MRGPRPPGPQAADLAVHERGAATPFAPGHPSRAKSARCVGTDPIHRAGEALRGETDQGFVPQGLVPALREPAPGGGLSQYKLDERLLSLTEALDV
jgi:hypothetical protein